MDGGITLFESNMKKPSDHSLTGCTILMQMMLWFCCVDNTHFYNVPSISTRHQFEQICVRRLNYFGVMQFFYFTMQVIDDKRFYCFVKGILWMVYCLCNSCPKVWDVSFGQVATHLYSKRSKRGSYKRRNLNLVRTWGSFNLREVIAHANS